MAMDRTTEGAGLLAQVREGMAVHDAAGAKVGTVRAVYPGTDGDPADARQQARDAITEVRAAMREPERPLGIGDIEAVGVGGLSGDGGHPIGPLTGAAAVDPDEPDQRVPEGPLGAQVPDDDLPREGRERLLQGGYIRINSAGLFARDRYAAPEQIAGVIADAVQLNVAGDALIAGG